MIKRWLVLLATLLWSPLAWAIDTGFVGLISSGQQSASPPTYIINNNLDAGVKPTDGNGVTWTASTNPIPDYISSGLEGFTHAINTQTSGDSGILTATFQAQNDIWFGIKTYTGSILGGSTDIVSFSNGTSTGGIGIFSTGVHIGAKHLGGSGFEQNACDFSTGYEYYLKVHYVSSTNTITLYQSATGAMDSWTTCISTSGGDSQAGITSITLGNTFSYSMKWNAMRLSTNDFNY